MKKQVNKLLSILTVVSTISILSIGLVSLVLKPIQHENLTLQAELSSTKSMLTIAHNEISVFRNELNDLVDEKESVESDQAYRERFEGFEVMVAEATAYAGDPYMRQVRFQRLAECG